MPTLAVHLRVVEEAAASIGSKVLSENMGDLFLGSTTPDIRNLIGTPREYTHFIGLAEDGGECGVGRFLQGHPIAADFSRLSEQGKAFVAGYLSHLAVDETWITEVYRPYFGRGSEWDALPEKGMLDRALQFELEERERRKLSDLKAIGGLMAQAEGFAGLGLAEETALRRWREFVVEALEIEDVGQRFRYFASNFVREGEIMTPNRINGFVMALRALAARALDHVPEVSIARFRQKSIDTSAEVFKEYIAGDFLALAKR